MTQEQVQYYNANRILALLDKLVALCCDAGCDCRWCVVENRCVEEYDSVINLAFNQPERFSYKIGKDRMLKVLINHPDYTGGVVTVGQEAL